MAKKKATKSQRRKSDRVRTPGENRKTRRPKAAGTGVAHYRKGTSGAVSSLE